MPSDPLEDAVYLKVAETIEDNYRGADGEIPVSPSAVASLATSAALAAIAEQGYAIVSAEDLRIVSSPRSPVLPDEIMAHLDARARLRAVLSGTAPQPSGTPQEAQTAGGGISGRSDTPNASTGLSAPHADDLRHRYAEALAEKFTRPIYRYDQKTDREWVDSPHPRDRLDSTLSVRFIASDGLPAYRAVTGNEAAEVCAAVRDTELERVSGYAERMAEMVIEKDREATQWAERLHKAEATITRAEALHSRDDSNPHGPWCGTCTTRWPCRTWIALLPAGHSSATTTEEKPNG